MTLRQLISALRSSNSFFDLKLGPSDIASGLLEADGRLRELEMRMKKLEAAQKATKA